MNKKDEIILEKHLSNVKKYVLKIWDQIDAASLEKVNSYHDLVEILKSRYNISDKQAFLKIKKLLTQICKHPASPSLEKLRYILYKQSQDGDKS